MARRILGTIAGIVVAMLVVGVMDYVSRMLVPDAASMPAQGFAAVPTTAKVVMALGWFLATLIGGFLGVLAGFIGGKLNMAIMRTMDVFYAFPSILLAVAISGAMGGGMMNGMVALTLVFIPPLCRIAETATTQVRGLDFVEAARASGGSTRSIIATHILGNVLGPIFIYASGLVSVSILIASGLSFLGLGVEPPHPDWGLMLSTLRQSIYVNPIVCALPGVMIFVTSLAFNMVSDGLRQAMDVRL